MIVEEQPRTIDFFRLKSRELKVKWPRNSPAFNDQVYKETEIKVDVMDGWRSAMTGALLSFTDVLNVSILVGQMSGSLPVIMSVKKNRN